MSLIASASPVVPRVRRSASAIAPAQRKKDSAPGRSSQSLPVQISGYVSREEIRPPERDDVAAFLEAQLQASPLTYTPENVQRAVDAIYAQVEAAIQTVPNGAEERLRYLSFAVSQARARLTQPQ